MQNSKLLDDVRLMRPAHTDATDQRMQRAHIERRTPQRHVDPEQAPAQLVEQLDIAVDLWCLAQDPAVDLPSRDRRTQTRVGAFGAKEFLSARGRSGWDIQRHVRDYSFGTK